MFFTAIVYLGHKDGTWERLTYEFSAEIDEETMDQDKIESELQFAADRELEKHIRFENYQFVYVRWP